MILSIFSCAYWPSVYLISRNLGHLFRSSAHFLIELGFLLLSCMRCLYSLDISPLVVVVVVIFANIFSQSVGCFFFCLWFPLLCNSLCLIRSHLFIFAFTSVALGDCPQKTVVQFMWENILPTFPSSFMGSCLMFKSLSRFEFIFEYGVRICSNFIDLHVTVQLCICCLLKRLSKRDLLINGHWSIK